MKTQSVHYNNQRSWLKRMRKRRNAKRKRGADDARFDPRAGPMYNARDRNLKDSAVGKEIRRAKL
jgi:hypothetical protein